MKNIVNILTNEIEIFSVSYVGCNYRDLSIILGKSDFEVLFFTLRKIIEDNAEKEEVEKLSFRPFTLTKSHNLAIRKAKRADENLNKWERLN